MLKERALPGLHEYVATLLPPMAGLSVLDVGCGTGAWLHRIRSDRTRLVGIDYEQPDSVAGMDLRRLNINTDAFDTLGKFDVVTCIEVIEHIENVGRLLDLIKATVAPEGLGIITTPNIESRRARTRALVNGKIPSFDEKSDPTHLMPILCDSLRKMLERRNMEITALHQFPPDSRRTFQFQRPVQVLSRLLPVPDDLHGDNVIYFVKHA